MARSPRMASSTPGYWTFTATARSSRRWGSHHSARWTWPIDAAAIGSGSHSTNSSSGRRAQLLGDDVGCQLRAHGRRLGLELAQRGAERLGQAFVEVAGHLADLHQRALHPAQAGGDVSGGPQLPFVIQRLGSLGRGEELAGRRRGVGAADTAAEPGHLEVAGSPRCVAEPAGGATPSIDPCGPTPPGPRRRGPRTPPPTAAGSGVARLPGPTSRTVSRRPPRAPARRRTCRR